MQQNQGAIREGLALLAGILRCGHCGGKLYVNYKKDEAMYFCDGAEVKGSRRCLSFGSSLMDKRLEEEVCRALQPLGIKAAKAALELKEKEASKDLQWARMQVEAAEYEADRAFQQFDLCDPKNRLVADSLEERLNSKLAALKEAKEKLGEIRKENRQLSDEQRERLDELAGDFQAVWQHPQADPRLKKRLLRQVINEIIVKHEPENHRLEVILHWQGGVHTRVHVPKRARPKGNKADASLLELLQQLAEELPDAEIARILNMKDVETPRGLRWTKDRVSEFRKQHRILGAKRPPSEDRLTLKQTCAYLGISYNGLLGLVRMGAVKSNQVTDFAPWRVSRSELDSAKVQELVSVLKKTGRLPKGGCPKNQATLFDC